MRKKIKRQKLTLQAVIFGGRNDNYITFQFARANF